MILYFDVVGVWGIAIKLRQPYLLMHCVISKIDPYGHWHKTKMIIKVDEAVYLIYYNRLLYD